MLSLTHPFYIPHFWYFIVPVSVLISLHVISIIQVSLKETNFFISTRETYLGFEQYWELRLDFRVCDDWMARHNCQKSEPYYYSYCILKPWPHRIILVLGRGRNSCFGAVFFSNAKCAHALALADSAKAKLNVLSRSAVLCSPNRTHFAPVFLNVCIRK